MTPELSYRQAPGLWVKAPDVFIFLTPLKATQNQQTFLTNFDASDHFETYFRVKSIYKYFSVPPQAWGLVEIRGFQVRETKL